jgi:DNA-binding transcriptional ArsR family regulator
MGDPLQSGPVPPGYGVDNSTNVEACVTYARGMDAEADIAGIAALLADPARVAMLDALFEGRALSAGELARRARVTAPTASAHLRRLLDGDLVAVEAQGRHRYYRLSGPAVAEAIEALGVIAKPRPVRSLRQSQQAQALRVARTCYDHLAGAVGVAVAEALVRGGALRPAGGRDYDLTMRGEDLFGGLGVDVAELGRQRRVFARQCLDWTERTPHLSGALGAALLARLLELGWVARGRVPRALVLTHAGRDGLARAFGCDAAALQDLAAGG